MRTVTEQLQTKLQGDWKTVTLQDCGFWYAQLTVDKARELLESMPKNRNLRMPIVRQYARTLERGDFRPDPSWPVVLEVGTRVLREGQHRCHAVIKTGIEPFVWFREMSLEQLEIMHTTCPRKLADSLVINYQIKNPDIVAAGARLASRWMIRKLHVANTNTQDGCMSSDEVIAFYKSLGLDPNQLAATAKMIAKKALPFRINIPAGQLAYFLIQRPDAIDWLLALLTDSGRPTASQKYARRVMTVGLRSKENKKAPVLYGLALACAAYNDPHAKKLPKPVYVDDLQETQLIGLPL